VTDHRRPVGVVVTRHALDRYLERFPDRSPDNATAFIYREVQQALAAGRRATRLPSWCDRAGYPTGRHSNRRFVWNEQLTRCYPLIRENKDHERAGEFGIRWRVMTTLAALTEEQRAEQRRLYRIDRENRGSGTGTRSRGSGALFGKRGPRR
jgi:hypothetical protein